MSKSDNIPIVRRTRLVPALRILSKHWISVDIERHKLGLDPVYESNFIDSGEPSCAACGWRTPLPDSEDQSVVWSYAAGWLDRAHLVDRYLGGPDTPDNVIPLCHICHRNMPSFSDRDKALEWIKKQANCPGWFQMVTESDSPEMPQDRYELRGMWNHMATQIARGALKI